MQTKRAKIIQKLYTNPADDQYALRFSINLRTWYQNTINAKEIL